MKSRPNWVLQTWLCAALLWGAAEPAAYCSTPTVLRLYPTGKTNSPSGAGFSISLNRAEPLTAPSNPETWGQAQLYAPTNQPFLILGALSEDGLDVELDAFPGWHATLPGESYVSLRSLDQDQSVELLADRHNQAPVSLVLPDGAQAQLSAGASIRFESFADHSYNLFGWGKVVARAADGPTPLLGAGLPPMTGGPVVRTTNAQNQVRLRRLEPRAALTFAGKPGGPAQVTARLEQKDMSLVRGAPRKVRLANGASLALELDAEAVRCHVERGYFIISIPGVPACQPHLWTGQSARLRWDTELHAAEVSAGKEPLLVALPNRNHAAVQPEAVLQVAQLNASTFAASAAQGEVELFDALSSRRSPLGQAQTVVRARQDWSGPTRLLVRVLRNNRGEFVLADPGENRRVVSAVIETWQVDGTHALRTRHDPELAQLDLQALTGNFRVQMPDAQNVEFELSEPNGIQWDITSDRPSTRAAARASNPTSIPIQTQFGQVLLAPGGEILVMSATWTLGMQPSAVFSELEPAGRSSSGLAPFDATQVYVPRVEQPPVSVVR